MKKIALILFCSFLMIIGFGCKANINEPENQVENQETPESPDPENQNPSNPSSPAAVLVNQFFWGQWQRMDNGKSYYINENNIKTDERLYSATSSSENYLNVEGLGRFEKQTDSVIINNSIPYFRKGGTNLSYKMKLVGFEDSINRAARAASSASLSGYTITGTSEQFESFTSEAVSDEDGTVILTAPTSGDVQTITVTSGDDTIVVVPGIKVETDGSNMGTIPISQEGQYSLKVTGTIEDTEKDDGYLYGNNYKSYPMTLTITNVSDVVSAPSVCTITAEDSRVTVSSADGSDITGGVLISTLKSGFTKTILLSVTCGTLTENYLDTGLIVTVKNAVTEKTWQDYVPLRFFKGLVPITVAAESVEENADAALNGFVIYPDGNSQFFSVPDKGDKTIYVPTFGSDQPYTLAFSGATIDGSLSNSTEMLYTVASGTWTKKKIDTTATAFIRAVQYGETGSGNGSEDNATVADSEFEAYLADGDVDFYEMGICSEKIVFPDRKKIYKVSYISEKGMVPDDVFVKEGEKLASFHLPMLGPFENYSFVGWFIGNYQITENYVIYSNVTLTAKWILTEQEYLIKYELNGGAFQMYEYYPDSYQYSATDSYFLSAPIRQGYTFIGWYRNQYFAGSPITEISAGTYGDLKLYAKWEPIEWTSETIENLDLSLFEEEYTVKVIGEITDVTLNTIINKIHNANSPINLDLSKATGITDITRNQSGDSIFKNCLSLKKIILPNCLTSIGTYAFWSCSSLESIIIPENVTAIGSMAFSGTKITEIKLPSNLASLSSYLFSGCSNLSAIKIPAKVSRIEPNVFSGCINLKSVEFEDVANWYYSIFSSDTGIYSSYLNPISVKVPSSNATYFTSTYVDKYWYKE